MSAATLALERVLPLTPGQERLVAGERRVIAGAPRRLESSAVLVEGPLDLGALQRALDVVTARHEALRATIRARGDGVPVQIVARGSVTLDVRDAGEADPAAAVTPLSRRPSDTDLLHVEVTRLAPERCVLAVSIHHAISDGWSVKVLFDELSEAYDATIEGRAPALPDLGGGYASVCERLWELRHRGGYDEQLAYWEARLAPPWPASAIGAPARVSGTVADVPLEGGSSATSALAGVALALHAETGERDIRIGTLVPARAEAALQNVIGFFANTVVLRLFVDREQSLEQLESAAKATLVDALARQDVPIQDVMQRMSAHPAFTPNALYDVMFAFEALREGDFTLRGTRCTELASPLPTPRRSPTTVALRWRFERWQGQMGGALTYAADRVELATAERLASRFARAIALIREAPGRSIGAALESM